MNGPRIAFVHDHDGDGRNDHCHQTGYQEKDAAGDAEYHVRVNNDARPGRQRVTFCYDPQIEAQADAGGQPVGHGCADSEARSRVDVVWTAAAGATSRQAARDPEDVEGRLDIIRVGARARGRRMVLRIRTAEAWRCSYLKSPVESYDSRGGTFRWHVDTNRDPYNEHTASYRCQGGTVFLDFPESGGTFEALKPDPRTVVVEVPRHRFGLDHRRVRLVAISRVDGRHRTTVLFDHEDYTTPLRPYR